MEDAVGDLHDEVERGPVRDIDVHHRDVLDAVDGVVVGVPHVDAAFRDLDEGVALDLQESRTFATPGRGDGGAPPGQRCGGESLADADADAGQDRVEVAMAGPASHRKALIGRSPQVPVLLPCFVGSESFLRAGNVLGRLHCDGRDRRAAVCGRGRETAKVRSGCIGKSAGHGLLLPGQDLQTPQ